MKKEITKEQFIEKIPKSEFVHTFRSAAFGLIGADWKRTEVLDALDKHEFGISGEQATRMKHGLWIKDTSGFVFIETNEEP